MPDTATLKTYLTAAETALHKVIMGEQVQVVGYDGRTVTYTPTSEAKLRSYIRELNYKLGNTTVARARPRGISVV